MYRYIWIFVYIQSISYTHQIEYGCLLFDTSYHSPPLQKDLQPPLASTLKQVQFLHKALDAASGRVSHAILPPPTSVLKDCLRARKTIYPEACFCKMAWCFFFLFLGCWFVFFLGLWCQMISLGTDVTGWQPCWCRRNQKNLRRYLDLGRRWLQMASAAKLILLKKMTMVLKGAHSFSIFLVMPARNPIGTRFFFQLYEVVPHSWITFSILLSRINSHRFISNKQMIWDVFFYSHIHPRNFHRILGIQEMPIVFVGALFVQDPLKLRREIDDWMANYDERQEEKKRLARETQVGIPCVFLLSKVHP